MAEKGKQSKFAMIIAAKDQFSGVFGRFTRGLRDSGRSCKCSPEWISKWEIRSGNKNGFPREFKTLRAC